MKSQSMIQYFEELTPIELDYLSQGKNYQSTQQIPARKCYSMYTLNDGQDLKDSRDAPYITQHTSTKHHYKMLQANSEEPIYRNSYSSFSSNDNDANITSITSLASQSLAHYIPSFMKIIGLGALVIASIWTYYNWSKVVSYFEDASQDAYDYFYPSYDNSESSNNDSWW